MKKIIGFLFLAIFAVTLTGCGKGNTVKCTANGKDLIDMDGKVEITAKFDSKDKFVEASATIILNDASTAKTLCEAMKSYVKSVKCSGKKIIFEKYTDFAGDDDDYSNMTKADFKAAMSQQSGVTCK